MPSPSPAGVWWAERQVGGGNSICLGCLPLSEQDERVGGRRISEQMKEVGGGRGHETWSNVPLTRLLDH